MTHLNRTYVTGKTLQWTSEKVGTRELTFTIYIYVQAAMGMHMYECGCLWRPEEGAGFPGVRVTGGCEPLSRVLGLKEAQ